MAAYKSSSFSIMHYNTKKEIIRFSIVGIFVGATDFGIYYFLINFLSFNFAKGISFICAGIVAYFLNKYWTFQDDQPSYAEVGRYILVNVLALVINIFINQNILNMWPGAVFLALASAAMVTGLLSFIFFKWWVFKAASKYNL